MSWPLEAAELGGEVVQKKYEDPVELDFENDSKINIEFETQENEEEVLGKNIGDPDEHKQSVRSAIIRQVRTDTC